jgi:hypothetical protein
MENQTQNAVELMMEKVTKMTQTIIAIGVIIAAFVLFYALLFKNFADGTAKDIVLFVLGCVSSNVTQIVSYYFGSSKSSEDKTKVLNNLSIKHNKE